MISTGPASDPETERDLGLAERSGPPELRLRPAVAADIPVLEWWDTRPHVQASGGEDGDYDWRVEIPRDLAWRQILIAEVGGRAIGVVVIIDPAREETHYWGDVLENLRAIDIWIGEEAYLGQGFGTTMMRQAIELCFAEAGVSAILIDPLATNERAIRFYRRLGFRLVQPQRFGTDDCLVLRLAREDWTGTGTNAQ